MIDCAFDVLIIDVKGLKIFLRKLWYVGGRSFELEADFRRLRFLLISFVIESYEMQNF